MNVVANMSVAPAWRACLQESEPLRYTLYSQFSLKGLRNGRKLSGHFQL